MEASLNASSILVEIIEFDKTFDLIAGESSDKVGRIIELTIDC